MSVNGVELHYEILGQGDPLILVHGSWDDHSTWDAVAPSLAESFQVVTYDRRGHGQSERPSAQGSRLEDEDDLAALIDALDCVAAQIVGNSFGASIALGLATRRPEIFRSLVVHEPPLIGLIAADPSFQSLLRDVQAKSQAVVDDLSQGNIVDGARRFIEEVALGPGAWDQLPENKRSIMIHNAPTFLDEQQDPEWASIAEPALARFGTSVLITHGDQSPSWFRPIVDRLGRTMKGAQVRSVPGAGHVPHATHPRDYLEILTDFLRV